MGAKGHTGDKMKELPKLPEKLGYDVCGRGSPEKFAITHLHNDHLPAVEGATLLVPPDIEREVRDKYTRRDIRVEIVSQENVRRTFHRFKNPRTRRWDRIDTYCHVIDDQYVVIPESNECWKLIREYSNRNYDVVFYRQPPAHHVKIPPKRHDLPEGWYHADDSTQEIYASNVLPQIAPSFDDGFITQI